MIVKQIIELFNCKVVDGIPADWRKAEVIPLFKKGDTRDVENYRLVSLTIAISKTQERLVRQAMYQHMVTNSILSDAQHGFVHQRSCLFNLDVCLMNLKKAFALVNRRLLLVKFRGLGFREVCITRGCQRLESFVCVIIYLSIKQRVSNGYIVNSDVAVIAPPLQVDTTVLVG